MSRSFVAVCFAAGVVLVSAFPVYAQDGSLRGYVKDDQGGVLPGVTVTATGRHGTAGQRKGFRMKTSENEARRAGKRTEDKGQGT